MKTLVRRSIWMLLVVPLVTVYVIELHRPHGPGAGARAGARRHV